MYEIDNYSLILLILGWGNSIAVGNKTDVFGLQVVCKNVIYGSGLIENTLKRYSDNYYKYELDIYYRFLANNKQFKDNWILKTMSLLTSGV